MHPLRGMQRSTRKSAVPVTATWSRCAQVSAETGGVPQLKDAHAVYLVCHNVMRIGQQKSRSMMTTGSFGYGRKIAGQQVRRDIAVLRVCNV